MLLCAGRPPTSSLIQGDRSPRADDAPVLRVVYEACHHAVVRSDNDLARRYSWGTPDWRVDYVGVAPLDVQVRIEAVNTRISIESTVSHEEQLFLLCQRKSIGDCKGRPCLDIRA